MSAEERKDDDPITEKLCEARRETISAEINGLKKCIYVSSCAVALVITAVQLVLTFWP